MDVAEMLSPIANALFPVASSYAAIAFKSNLNDLGLSKSIITSLFLCLIRGIMIPLY
jgi:hypothetical protein